MLLGGLSQNFEKGLLSHEKVCNVDCKVMKSIEEGFSYFEFVNWHAGFSKHGMCTEVIY